MFDLCNFSFKDASALSHASSALQGFLRNASSDIEGIIKFLQDVCDCISFVIAEIKNQQETISRAAEQLEREVNSYSSENKTEQEIDFATYDFKVRSERIEAAKKALEPYIRKYSKMSQTYYGYLNSARAIQAELNEAERYASYRGGQIDNAISAAEQAMTQFNNVKLSFNTSQPNSSIKPIIED